MAQDSNMSDDDSDVLKETSADDSLNDQDDDETNVEIGVDVFYDDLDETNTTGEDNSTPVKNNHHKINLTDYKTTNPIFLVLITILTIVIMPFGRHDWFFMSSFFLSIIFLGLPKIYILL